MVWPWIFFGTALAAVIAFTAVDRQVFRDRRDRLVAVGLWLLGLPLMLLRSRLSDQPLRTSLLGVGLMLWTLVVITGGRPAVIMNQLMTPEVRAETRTRRAVALAGIAASVVVGAIVFLIAPGPPTE